MKTFLRGLCTVVLFFQMVPAAWAYIPPSRFVIEKWAKKHEKIKHVLIVSRVSKIVDDELTGTAFVERTLYRSDLKSLQSHVIDSDGEVMFSKTRSLTLPGIEKQPPAPPPVKKVIPKGESAENTELIKTPYPFHPDYLFNWDQILKIPDLPLVSFLLFDEFPEDIFASLRRYDLPVVVQADLIDTQTVEERRIREQMHLRRLNNRYAWVIGSVVEKGKEAASATTPQIWIEKDTFMPLRLFIPNKSSSSSISFDGLAEIRFENYRYAKTFPYPHQISLYSGGKEILRKSIEKIEVDGKLDAEKFGMADGFTEQGRAKLSGSIKDLVDLYYSFLR